jgi:hypothetical protein
MLRRRTLSSSILDDSRPARPHHPQRRRTGCRPGSLRADRRAAQDRANRLPRASAANSVDMMSNCSYSFSYLPYD